MTQKNFNDMKAIDALWIANLISVGPFVFQAVKSMKDLGIMDALSVCKSNEGKTKVALATETKQSYYTVSVLLDLAETADVVIKLADNSYQLSKVGIYLNDDLMTKVNFNFTADVCYQGLEKLTESLTSAKPVGLEVFTKDEQTIYPFLSRLPSKAKESWFAFDHFYSDHVFERALEILFSKHKYQHIYDIGGNTGKFAMSATSFDKDVKVTIIDLKEQCALANENIKANSLENRISTYPTNVLAPNFTLPHDADLWWMSQFLDCFNQEQIESILKTVYESMNDDATLVINEIFGDRQKNDIAKLVIEANSLYFTALANGVSRFYHYDEFIALVNKIGFKLEAIHDYLGMGHTLLVLKK